MKFSIGQSGNPGGRPKVLGEVPRFLKPHVRAAGTNFPTSGTSSQKSRLIEPLVNTKNCYISKAQNLRPRPIFQCQKDCQPFASIAATGSDMAASCVAASAKVRASRKVRARDGSRDVATSGQRHGPPASRPIAAA